MRTRRWLLPLAVFIAACRSTPPAPEPAPRVAAETVRVLDFAKERGLKASWDPRRHRWLLEDGDARVLLFSGTDLAVVNGRRVTGMGSIAGEGTECVISRADAGRLERALEAIPPRKVAPATTFVPAVPAPPAPDEGPPEPFPGVKVPLRRTWRYVVIHHSGTTEGSASAFHRFHSEVRGWDGLGYHFVIGNGSGSGNGEVEVGYRWTQQLHGAHAGRPPDGSNTMNETGIGICLVGDFNRAAPTAAERAALRKLLDFLLPYCDIPPGNVLLHRDIRGTDCPGRYFPAAEFRGRRAR